MGIKKLISEEYVVLDGGMGTLLQGHGLDTEHLPEEWNISHPDIVKNIHLDYLRSGAQIIETNTFGASGIKLGMKGRADLMKEVNLNGAELALQALKEFMQLDRVDDERYIAGSVGPTGKMVGIDITQEEVKTNFASQGLILAEHGVDLFIVETMMDLNEAGIALEVLKIETGLPVLVSLVFKRTKLGDYRTLFGNTIPETVEKLINSGADAIGTNCGLIDEYIEVAAQMRALTGIPLVLYPNAGIPKLKDGRTYFEQTPESMISFLEKEVEAGATIIGGCCGTTPAYIHLIAERLKDRKQRPLK